MNSVRLSEQSTTLLRTFVLNPEDPLDVQNSGRRQSNASTLTLTSQKDLSLNFYPPQDQIDPSELRSLLQAVKNLTPKTKSLFSSQAKWIGPILTLISCAAAAYAYMEYSNLADQNAQCQKKLVQATQHANLIPLNPQALFFDIANFVSTTAKTIFDYFIPTFYKENERPSCDFTTSMEFKEPNSNTTYLQKMAYWQNLDNNSKHFEYSYFKQAESGAQDQIAQFRCQEQVTLDSHQYKMDITSSCTGKYPVGSDAFATYQSQENMHINSTALGPNAFLQVLHTIVQSETSDKNQASSFAHTNRFTTIDNFKNEARDSAWLKQILDTLKRNQFVPS